MISTTVFEAQGISSTCYCNLGLFIFNKFEEVKNEKRIQ